ncbi:MAG: hypothetical protein MH472_14615, partial [Bacteroidia bacterium]|nr:hypothetical protein [Bacteroidia bacterium]
YLVVLPDAWTHISIMQMQQIIDKTNKTFKDLGVDTEVRLFNGTDFKAENMDKTDAVAVIGGTKLTTSTFIKSNIDNSKGEELINNWKDGIGYTKLETTSLNGNFIAIDASKLDYFATKVYKTDKNNTLAYTINHATGHIAGEPDGIGLDPVIMTDGSKTKGYIDGDFPGRTSLKKLEDFIKPNENTGYKKIIEGKMGVNKPKDNYHLNATKNALKSQLKKR